MIFKKKLDYNDEKQTPLNNLTQKIVQEHKKIFSYNQYQNPNKLKHFIVDNWPKNEPLQEVEDTNLDIEIDIIADIKNNNSSEQTDHRFRGIQA